MFLDSFDKKGTLRRAAATLLIAILVLASSPIPLVLAEEDGEVVSVEGTGGDGGSTGDSGNGEGDVVIDTGDAVAETGITNEVNTNTTDTTGDGEEEETNGEDGEIENTDDGTTEGGEGTSTPETLLDEGEGTTTPTILEDEGDEIDSTTATSTPGAASTTVSNLNDAEVGNSATTTAETGDNAATSTDAGALIETGQAIAAANIVNVVNTNIINSLGFLILLSALFGGSTFDLRLLDFSSWLNPAPEGPEAVSEGGEEEEGGSPCSPSICGVGNAQLTASSTNNAVIENDVVVRAETGGNSAGAGGGSAVVSTGNAYASANVINVANTNIIDSNYLLLALNNFGDFSGDIVFPGIEFFTALLSQGGGTPANVAVSNNNTAEVENMVAVGADTGGNAATSTDGALIDTGNAVADANVVNQVNTNLFGGTSLYILLRVHGDWSGNIFGLPPGLAWSQTAAGIEIYSTGEGADTNPPRYQSLTATNDNTASISNNISVYALTGENQVSAEGGDALIETGDAYAAANVVNVANTNVIGQNWMLAVFNIFGNWSGNLSFGRPDLWVGARAESPNNPLQPGSEVTYHFTVTNFGDAEATDVMLENEFDGGLLSIDGGDEPLNLGTLAPGESTEVSYTAEVSTSLGYGETPVMLETTVVSNETDNNPTDNTERLSLVARRVLPLILSTFRLGPGGEENSQRADLELVKSTSVEETVASSTVDYTIVVTNHGASAYEAVLVDVLLDPDGVEISRQDWDLDEIYPDEEITVTYTVVYDGATKPGVYTNEAQVLAMDEWSYEDDAYASANSNVATASVVVASGICEPLLSSYLRLGGDNDSDEVRDLQRFLRQYEGHDLEVTSVFDGETASAVRAFQNHYAESILSPWGLFGASGYVYYTTQRKVNELYCKGDQAFNLSSLQLEEIAAYRERLEQALLEDEPLPDMSEVGDASGSDDEVIVQEEPKREIQSANVSRAVERSLGKRFFKALSDAFGNITSWVNDDGMFQSHR